MFIIHATMQIDPAKQNEFLQAVQPLLTASRAENGNISYDLLIDPDRNHIYKMIEVWQDQEAISSHNTSEHFTGFTAQAGNFLTAPLDVKIYSAEPIAL